MTRQRTWGWGGWRWGASAGGAAAPTPDPLAAYYGTGLGQIPLRLDPLDAVMSGTVNVASIPNKGGAGAAFNATSNGTTPITRSGGLLNFTATAQAQMAMPADFFDVRLFAVVQRPSQPSSFSTVLRSATSGEGNGDFRLDEDGAAHLRYRVYKRQNAANAYVTTNYTPIRTDLHLIEFEMLSSGAAYCAVSGAPITIAAQGVLPPLPLQIFGGALFSMGEAISVITNGTAAANPAIAAVRAHLATKYGITAAQA